MKVSHSVDVENVSDSLLAARKPNGGEVSNLRTSTCGVSALGKPLWSDLVEEDDEFPMQVENRFCSPVPHEELHRERDDIQESVCDEEDEDWELVEYELCVEDLARGACLYLPRFDRFFMWLQDGEKGSVHDSLGSANVKDVKKR